MTPSFRAPSPVPPEADFSVTVTGTELEPYIPRGGTAYCVRTADLQDGEVGLFLVRGRALFRQYCEDSLGTVYLFAVNRRLRRLDESLPAGEPVVCFGRVLLPPIPLP